MNVDIVVTGLGAVTPSGGDVPSTWEGLAAGRSAIGQITRCDTTDLEARLAAEVQGFDPVAVMGVKRARRSARFSQFAVAAAREAVADAALTIDEDLSPRVAVIINTAVSGVAPTEDAVRTMGTDGPLAVSPFFVPQMIPSVPACEVAIDLGVHGPVTASALACASGTAALLEARRMLLCGEADVVVAGGTDAPLVRSLLGGLGAMGALSARNDDPQAASRPFDADRDGFVPGEGAVVAVLERAPDAAARGARAYGVVAGGALTSDAYHLSAPDRQGRFATAAIRQALERADLAPQDIDYVCAHGTSTPANDRTETKALHAAFGSAIDGVAVSSPKSMLGHLMGGAGTLSALVCLMAMRDGIVPPTINLDTVDPECDLDHVANVARTTPVRAAVANAFGFGGQNCVVVLRAP